MDYELFRSTDRHLFVPEPPRTDIGLRGVRRVLFADGLVPPRARVQLPGVNRVELQRDAQEIEVIRLSHA